MQPQAPEVVRRLAGAVRLSVASAQLRHRRAHLAVPDARR
jgi:hypothetical protein